MTSHECLWCQAGIHTAKDHAKDALQVVLVETPIERKPIQPVTASGFLPKEETNKQYFRYACACVRDSFLRGEVPLSSWLLYGQPGLLKLDDAKERELMLEAGLFLARKAQATITAVYTDCGISVSMEKGIFESLAFGRRVEYRSLKK